MGAESWVFGAGFGFRVQRLIFLLLAVLWCSGLEFWVCGLEFWVVGSRAKGLRFNVLGVGSQRCGFRV